jgi:hypothetical protein
MRKRKRYCEPCSHLPEYKGRSHLPEYKGRFITTNLKKLSGWKSCTKNKEMNSAGFRSMDRRFKSRERSLKSDI